MKFFSALLLTLGFATVAQAQITISQSDLPHAGDMYLMSNGDLTSIELSELEITGADQAWSFNLESTGQQTDTMFSLLNVPPVYFVFIGADYATHTATGFSLPIPGFSFSVNNIYNFFNLSSTRLEQTGMGANVNGFDLPIFFDDNDEVYQLPLQYNNTWTSTSSFNAVVPTFGGWAQSRERNSVVDGWGTLQGPLGTQQVLRVKSTVAYVDSISVSTPFGDFGFPFPHEEIEYKWLSANGGVPLLQITTTVVPLVGTETVSRVQYRDTLLTTALTQTFANNQPVSLYPQPATDRVTVLNPFGDEGAVRMVVCDAIGRLVTDKRIERTKVIDVDVSSYAAGVYLLTLQSGDKSFTRRVAVTR